VANDAQHTLVAESLLESLALLKKADVEPTEKFAELNRLPTLAKQLYADPAFDLEQTIPCKVFVKWCVVGNSLDILL
jgi:hypothetical protein